LDVFVERDAQPGGGFLDDGSAFGVYSRLDLHRAAKVARDAAYVAVGLGVIATQRATARRYDIEQRVKEVAPRVRDEAKATAERVMREANDAVTKVRGEATQRVRNIVDRRKATTTNVA